MSITHENTFEQRLAEAAAHQVPVAGSVGRAAILGEAWISSIRPTGTERDIDAVNIAQHTASATKLEPARGRFDIYWLPPFVIKENGQDELIYPGRYRGTPEVPPKVKVVVPQLHELLIPDGYRTINNQPVLVLKPEAQLALDKMRGPIHPKNVASVRQLEALVSKLSPGERIAPEVLTPFEEFSQQVESLLRVKLYKLGRRSYHELLSVRAATRIHPVIKRAVRSTRLI